MTVVLISSLKCFNCDGTGIDTKSEHKGNPCADCATTGRIENARIDITDLQLDVSNILDAVIPTKTTVEGINGKIDALQNTCDKILEIVGKEK